MLGPIVSHQRFCDHLFTGFDSLMPQSGQHLRITFPAENRIHDRQASLSGDVAESRDAIADSSGPALSAYDERESPPSALDSPGAATANARHRSPAPAGTRLVIIPPSAKTATTDSPTHPSADPVRSSRAAR